MLNERVEPYAAAIRKLLKGVIYHDDPVWSQLRDYELPIREYLGKIGLALHLDEIGNFAYLEDESRDDDSMGALPPLTTRRALSFADTLLLVLLRERLDEHEIRDLDGTRLILGEEDLTEMIMVFLADTPNAQKTAKGIGTSINRLTKSGFLTARRDGRYEVRPLIRAKISADELDDIKRRLVEYVEPDNDHNEEDE